MYFVVFVFYYYYLLFATGQIEISNETWNEESHLKFIYLYIHTYMHKKNPHIVNVSYRRFIRMCVCDVRVWMCVCVTIELPIYVYMYVYTYRYIYTYIIFIFILNVCICFHFYTFNLFISFLGGEFVDFFLLIASSFWLLRMRMDVCMLGCICMYL